MKKWTRIIIGVVLIVIAVIAVLVAQSRYETASGVWGQLTVAESYTMRQEADIVKYSGIGVGFIGGILLLAGLLKKNE